MAKLARTVFLRDPEQGPVRLEAGEEVPDRLAPLIPNPVAWSGAAPPPDEATPNPVGADGDAADTPTVADPAPEPEPVRVPRRRTAKVAGAGA
jgi:DNA polymerase-3 subunit gamma/tau